MGISCMNLDEFAMIHCIVMIPNIHQYSIDIHSILLSNNVELLDPVIAMDSQYCGHSYGYSQ